MIRTGEIYQGSIRGCHEIYINGDCVGDVPEHPQVGSLVEPRLEVRTRIFDRQHNDVHQYRMALEENIDVSASASALSCSQAVREKWSKLVIKDCATLGWFSTCTAAHL